MFRPGDSISESAPYLVHHEKHREPHVAYGKAGRSFPFCRKCGEAVRFTLLDVSVFKAHACLDSDPDFSPAASAGSL